MQLRLWGLGDIVVAGGKNFPEKSTKTKKFLSLTMPCAILRDAHGSLYGVTQLRSSAFMITHLFSQLLFLLFFFSIRFNELYGCLRSIKGAYQDQQHSTRFNIFFLIFLCFAVDIFPFSCTSLYRRIRLESSLFFGTHRNATNDKTIFHVVGRQH